MTDHSDLIARLARRDNTKGIGGLIDEAAGALTALTRIGPETPDNSMVICPVCTSQFGAISVDDQAKVAALEKQVRLAAGMLSTTGRFANQHPEVALRFIQDAQVKDDARMSGGQFTDGRGNDITHLVGEKR